MSSSVLFIKTLDSIYAKMTGLERGHEKSFGTVGGQRARMHSLIKLLPILIEKDLRRDEDENAQGDGRGDRGDDAAA